MRSSLNKQQQGFGLVEILVIIIIVLLVSFAGYFVYSRHSKKAGPASTPHTSTTPPAASSQSNTKTSTDSSLKSGTLKYEKISYKYPSDWKVEDTSNTAPENVTPGFDAVVLTAPNGLRVSLRTGIDGVGDGQTKAIGGSVTALGQTFPLGIGADFDGNADPNDISSIHLTSNDNVFIYGKNVTPIGGTKPALMTFEINAGADANGGDKDTSVHFLQTNSAYQQALDILGSLTY